MDISCSICGSQSVNYESWGLSGPKSSLLIVIFSESNTTLPVKGWGFNDPRPNPFTTIRSLNLIWFYCNGLVSVNLYPLRYFVLCQRFKRFSLSFVGLIITLTFLYWSLPSNVWSYLTLLISFCRVLLT